MANEVKCYSPLPYNISQYKKKIQQVQIDTSNQVIDKQTKLLQHVCGIFLYYVIAIYFTMLHALNNLATKAVCRTQ